MNSTPPVSFTWSTSTICAKHLQRDGCDGAKDRFSGFPDPVARRPEELHDRPGKSEADGPEQAGQGITTEQKSGMKMIGDVVISLIISYS